jgi:ribosomal protein S18 acetylase RimI-like enzyme
VTLGVGFEQCRRVCTDPRFQVFLASTGAQRSGVLILDEAGVAGAPYLKSIAVAEGLRGKGVGAALMDHCEAWAGMRSRHLFLCVSSFNTLARAFYERRGFTEVGELQDFIIPGASEVLMHRLVR